MADNNPNLRAQPEDEYYYHHHIRGNGLTILFPTYTDLQAKIISLGNDRPLSSYCKTIFVLQNHIPPATEMFKGSHTDTVLENDLLQTTKRFKFSDECQI